MVQKKGEKTMITHFDFVNIVEKVDKVLENKEAVVLYFGGGYYMAVSKEIKGKEYTFSGLYHNSTAGNFKRCKKAFEKYSPHMISRN